MKIVVSHPTGNRNVRAVVEGLYQADSLYRFATTIAVDGKEKWLRLLPGAFKNELLRRSYNIPKSYIQSSPFLELARIVLPKLGFKKAVQHETGWASVDAVYKSLDTKVARYLAKNGDAINAVYAYEDGALQTFRKAKEIGIACIYDLPIAYWETLRSQLLKEAERRPEWKKTLGGGVTDSTAKLERKTKELELADAVIVPGNFVGNSLPEWARNKKIIVSPFGTPKTTSTALFSKKTPAANRPLRVLFAGSLGQRKGLADLFNAIQLLNTTAIELVVMGPLIDTLDFYKRQLPGFTYEPVRPHHKVLELMQTCDIFCLPSIVEGRALVMQEAMSQGLPIIITPNTGGEDLVLEGKTGFLVPVRSPEAIASRINWFLENREAIPAMGEAAKAHAATYTWEAYASRIVAGIT